MALALRGGRIKLSQCCNTLIQRANISNFERALIGKREIVGYGYNGQPNYADRSDFPFPAIRWKEPTCEIDALKSKEQGDWNLLTCQEKKDLYRASFCQTYAEFQMGNSGEWKSIAAGTLFLVATGLWLFIYTKLTLYTQYPDSFCEESRASQFRRYLDLRMNPIEGISSRWNYDLDDWKNPNDPWKTKAKTTKE